MSRAYDHSPVSQITLEGHLSLEHHLSLGPQACPPLPVYAIMLIKDNLVTQTSAKPHSHIVSKQQFHYHLSQTKSISVHGNI